MQRRDQAAFSARVSRVKDALSLGDVAAAMVQGSSAAGWDWWRTRARKVARWAR